LTAAIDQMGRAPASAVPHIWPQIEQKAVDALRRFDLYGVEDVRELVDSGAWELWVATVGPRVAAFCVVEVAEFPRRRVMIIHVSGGDSAETHNALWPLIKASAKARGCSRVISDPRRGWFRAGKMPADWQHIADTAMAEVA
jgi:hypothetical protein